MTGALVTRNASNVGWAPRDELTHDDWQEAGRQLGTIGKGVQWWIGDWINYGAKAYGDKYVEALDLTGYDPGTLMNLAWVASRYETSLRRENLSWTHHKELAALEPQDRDHWLDRCEAESLSQKQLRNELKRAQAVESTATPEPTDRHPAIRVTLEQEGDDPEALKAAAEKLAKAAEPLGFTVTAQALTD